MANEIFVKVNGVSVISDEVADMINHGDKNGVKRERDKWRFRIQKRIDEMKEGNALLERMLPQMGERSSSPVTRAIECNKQRVEELGGLLK